MVSFTIKVKEQVTIMNLPISFLRILFLIISIALSVSFAAHYFEGGLNFINTAVGVLGGIVIAGLMVGLDSLFARVNLKLFNTAIFGLFCGYLMATALIYIFNAVLETSMPSVNFVVYLSCAYIGIVVAFRTSEEFHVSIPFVQFKHMSHKKKDILVDISILTDPRIIDLASSGLLDHHLILPRFAVKELYAMAESGDEATKSKARRSLELVKKLESTPTLDLRYVDTDFPEIKDPMTKLVRLARFLDTNIITSDINRIQQSTIEGVRIINIHMLSNALKPITQAGEYINIKIQRYGKEARQGVGYLEDGTMVVVNGGAEFIGESIKVQVLSVKHTSSGRMIFCNTCEEASLLAESGLMSANLAEMEGSHKNYFAL